MPRKKKTQQEEIAPKEKAQTSPVETITPEPATEVTQAKPAKIKNKAYKDELAKLQVELVKLQEWIKHKGLKVVAIFEGRDAAGKGGVIKRITQSLNPRICRVVALGTPTRAGENAMVLSALRPASTGRRRDGPF